MAERIGPWYGKPSAVSRAAKFPRAWRRGLRSERSARINHGKGLSRAVNAGLAPVCYD
jgi:hypothetical protein